MMGPFHFLRPLWFLALLPLFGLLWLLWRRRLRSRSWQEVCDPELLPHLLLGRSRRRANWPLWLLFAGMVLAVTALAGPTWKKQPQPLFRQQSALVILFDLSRSMNAGDLKPSRLVRARLKIEDILRQRIEGQTALVAFAGDAFAVTPLTDDRHAIEALLDSLDPEMMPVQGSEAGRALELAAELLRRAGLKEGTVLLVTDEDRPQRLVEAARSLRRQGLQLAVLGVGTPEGAPIPLPKGGFFKNRTGNLVLPRLDEAGLRNLAEAGGGAYRRISIDDGDFRALLADLESRRFDRGERVTRLGDRWQDSGVWLLWPVTLLAAAAFRRGWLMTLVLLLLLPPPAEAMSWQDLWQRPDQHAHSDFEAGRYVAASGRFEDPRWKASALYRAGQYDEALKVQPQAQSADDWYNRGNALARAGQLSEALKAYDEALKGHPGDEDARHNRQLVEQALQQQKQQQQQQQGGEKTDQSQKQVDQKPQGGEGNQGKGRQGQTDHQGVKDPSDPDTSEESARSGHPPPQAQQQRGEQQGADPSAADRRDALPDQTPKPADDQKQTSAAQRAGERYQELQEPTTSAATADQPPENAEQREMKQWLQRIPDDPGGLLRRKFLYQYRQRGRQLETDRPW